MSPLEHAELEKQVTKFLKDGILETSTSPYGAPVLFVPKPNGRGLRLCVDYRALNSITVKNRCMIPRIDDLLDAVAGSKYFTSLDFVTVGQLKRSAGRITKHTYGSHVRKPWLQAFSDGGACSVKMLSFCSRQFCLLVGNSHFE